MGSQHVTITDTRDCVRAVTSQVTTCLSLTVPHQTEPDGEPALICADLTTSDHARRIRHGWHARGQGFESP
jgi:hypothetical protein